MSKQDSLTLPSKAGTALLTCLLVLMPMLAATADEVRFAGPFGIGVKPDGSFYVAEIQGKRIARFDAQGRSLGYLTEIPGYGPLQGPFDIDVAPSGNLYIADTLGHCVLVLDHNERLLLTLGTGQALAAPGTFHEPHFVVPDEQRERIIVADTHNHRLQVFDTKGKLLKVLGRAGKKHPGEYYFCNGPAVHRSGRVYAMNWTGAYINTYDHQLNVTGTFGGLGRDPGRFSDAYSIAVHEDTIWVADTYNNRLQQFSLAGKLLNIIGGEEGSDIHHFSHPTDLDFDRQGNIYVADWMNDRIIKLDPDGHVLNTWGSRTAFLDFTPPNVLQRPSCSGPIEVGTYSSLQKITIDRTKAIGADWIYYSCGNQSGDWAISRAEVDYARAQQIKAGVSIAVFPLGAQDPRWVDAPEYFMWKKGGTEPARAALSYFFPEVRRWKVQHIAAQIKRLKLDGIFLDYIRYPNALYGYEPAMVAAFRDQTGRDAHAISPYDTEWLKFRARYVTLFIAELRYQLAQLDWPVQVSVFVNPDPAQNLRSSLQEWPVWCRMGIIDKIHLGVYTRHIPTIYDSVTTARVHCPEKTKISMMLCCWGGNLNTPNLLHKGADVALAAGADDITIYRGDAIDRLDFWPIIGAIIEKHK